MKLTHEKIYGKQITRLLQLKTQGIDFKNIVQRTGISHSLLSNLMAGKRGLSIESYLLLEEALNFFEKENKKVKKDTRQKIVDEYHKNLKG